MVHNDILSSDHRCDLFDGDDKYIMKVSHRGLIRDSPDEFMRALEERLQEFQRTYL